MNPEFQRQIWLQITPLKLIIAPLILGIILFGLQSSHYLTLDKVTEAALWAFHCIMGIWATRRAADSMAEEIASHSWDSQRMSSLSAWQMVWGKILGATIYPWYCALWLLGLLIIFGEHFQEEKIFIGSPFLLVAFLIFTSLAASAVSFLVLLLSYHKAEDGKKVSTTLAQLAGLLCYALIFGKVLIQLLADGSDEKTWYGLEIESPYFLCVFSLFVAGWVWVGAVRTMQAELQYKQRSWVFITFLGALFLFLYGFAWGERNVINIFGAYLSIAYLAFFAEKKIPDSYRLSMREKPLWIIAFSTAILVGLWVMLQAEGQSFSTLSFSPFEEIYSRKQVPASILIISTLLFALRDLLFLTWLNFWKKKNADLTGLLLLMVFYWPFASLLRWLGSDFLNAFVRPADYGGLLLNFGPVAAEILLLILMLRLYLSKKIRGRAYAG